MLNTLRSSHASQPGAPLAYRPDIDGLRAVAVTSVVLFHAGVPGISGGFAGVDVFFVISGYLITSLILKDLEWDRFSFWNFYLRRAKRIFPALAVVMAATVALGWFILLPGDFKRLGTSMLATSFFVSNFHFAENVGYFSGPAIERPLLHTWSLAIEEQFYILFPALLAVLLWRQGRARTVLALFVLSLVSLGFAEIMVRHSLETVFYLPHARAWELLLGALTAMQQDRIWLNRVVAFLLSAAGLAALAFSMTMYGPETPFPGFTAVLPCLGAAMLLLAGGKAGTAVQAVLAVAPVRFIGRISYSLYLWHWPLFSLAQYHLDRAPTMVESAALVTASVVLATLTWWMVEQPVRTSALGLEDPRRGIQFAAAPLALLAAVGVGLIVTNGLPKRLPRDVAEAYHQSMTRASFLKTCASATGEGRASGCTFGSAPRDGSYDMVIWGDSHARHFAPVLGMIAEQAGLSGWQITPSACAPLLGVTVLNTDRSARRECENKDEVIKQFIRLNKNLKVIVIAARWSLYAGADDDLQGAAEHYLVTGAASQAGIQNSRRIMGEELQKTVDYFLSQGLEVVVLGQVPQFPFMPIRCNMRKMMSPANAHDCSVAYDTERRILDYSNGLIRALNTDMKLTRIFPHEFLCEGGVCKSAIGGTILYRDPTHLTPAGAGTFYPFLSERFRPLLVRLR